MKLRPLAWRPANVFTAIEDDPAITTYFVEGGNHSLDTPEDYTIGLEALKHIVRKYEEAMR